VFSQGSVRGLWTDQHRGNHTEGPRREDGKRGPGSKTLAWPVSVCKTGTIQESWYLNVSWAKVKRRRYTIEKEQFQKNTTPVDLQLHPHAGEEEEKLTPYKDQSKPCEKAGSEISRRKGPRKLVDQVKCAGRQARSDSLSDPSTRARNDQDQEGEKNSRWGKKSRKLDKTISLPHDWEGGGEQGHLQRPGGGGSANLENEKSSPAKKKGHEMPETLKN